MKEKDNKSTIYECFPKYIIDNFGPMSTMGKLQVSFLFVNNGISGGIMLPIFEG